MMDTAFGRQGPEVRILFPRPAFPPIPADTYDDPCKTLPERARTDRERAYTSGTTSKSRPSRERPCDRHERKLAEAAARDEARFRRSLIEAPLSEGFCYFVGTQEGGDEIVKIGFSRRVSQRVAALKAKSGPIKLHLLAVARGGYETEHHYHRLFANDAMGGEWFRLTPAIEAEIAKVNAIAPLGWHRARAA